MKKILLVMTALALISCEKEIQDNQQNYPEEKKAELKISIVPDTQTKATGSAHEQNAKYNKVNTLDIFVFRNDGNAVLEDVRHLSGQELSPDLKNISVSTTTGPKTVFAIANSHQQSWSKINDFADFSKEIASVKKDQSEDFIMVGNSDVIVSTSTHLDLTISRLACRIEVDRIATDFSNTSLEGKVLENVKLYLINMKGSKLIADNKDDNDENFLNRTKYIAADINGAADASMFYETMNSPIDQAGHNTHHFFYCYENAVQGHSIEKPATKLIVEGQIDGKTYYYPVEINQNLFGHQADTDHFGVKRNHSYSMSIVIKRLGSTDPDKPLQYGTLEVGLKVADWITVPNADIIF